MRATPRPPWAEKGGYDPRGFPSWAPCLRKGKLSSCWKEKKEAFGTSPRAEAQQEKLDAQDHPGENGCRGTDSPHRRIGQSKRPQGNGESQKPRFLLRRFRRLPLDLPSQGLGAAPWPNPPSEKLGLRGRRSSASLTRKRRPRNSKSLNFSIANVTDASSENSTKANPLGRPVLRSVGTKTSTTAPTSTKRASSSLSVASKLKFPTKILLMMTPFFCRCVPHQLPREASFALAQPLLPLWLFLGSFL